MEQYLIYVCHSCGEAFDVEGNARIVRCPECLEWTEDDDTE